ncbi:MAG: tryptophan synthase, alpha subunit [Bacteroidetes bacterium]|nr:MAG: tryptophan synthase, alpha subunit [Bacteroidota bacterium]
MKNRIDLLFEKKHAEILSVYFTAGFPERDDTLPLLELLEAGGADMVEIGIPFSDPLADGPVIQQSSSAALKNGMSMRLLFSQLRDVRKKISMPLILMGYLNPVLQFGMENFCRSCRESGIDGVILPDLPPDMFEEEYKEMFAEYGLHIIFLITPQTSEERVRRIDDLSGGFVYLVSDSATTGSRNSFSEKQQIYFERIRAMKLRNPSLIGFGIHNRETFTRACGFASGAIVGSAFIRSLAENKDIMQAVQSFVQSVKKENHDHSVA